MIQSTTSAGDAGANSREGLTLLRAGDWQFPQVRARRSAGHLSPRFGLDAVGSTAHYFPRKDKNCTTAADRALRSTPDGSRNGPRILSNRNRVESAPASP